MKYPHILFLDFDGPLFPAKALLMKENNEENSPVMLELKLHPMVSYWRADPMALAMLNHLYKIRSFQIVLSNQWSEVHEREDIERLFLKNNFNLPMHENWKTIKNPEENRANEIAHWLSTNPHSDYLILDDEDSGMSLMDDKILKINELKKEKIMIIDFEEGITMRNFYQMQAIIANWK